MRIQLFLLSVIFLSFFTYFSYTVAKENWQQFDFDSTVKLQDHLPRKYDQIFSYFSLLGSIEATVGISIFFAILALLKWKWWVILGWSMILPATLGEIFGKLVLFHPGPPILFHRSLLPTSLPSFYIHTNFSYPSGHMTRTIFILTVLLVLVASSKINKGVTFFLIALLAALAFLMGVTRVYLGEHWISDVVGGALLGSSMALFAAVLILRPQKGIT